MLNMASRNSKMEEKCQICEGTHRLLDPWAEEFKHLQEKLESVTNSEGHHDNWLRFLCICCKKKLDDLWEFKILCKNAYRKFLDNLQDIPDCDFSYDMKDDWQQDSEPDDKNCIDIIGTEEDDKKYLEAFEMVLVHEENSNDKTGKRSQKTRDKIPKGRKKSTKTNDEGKTKTKRRKKPNRPDKVDRRLKGNRQQKPALPGPYICAFCDKQFMAKQNIRQHIVVVHGNTRNFLCNFCGRRCVNRQSLIVHEQTHNENRARVPCDYCKETFSTKHTLNKHLRLVHMQLRRQEERYWVCQQCGVTTEGRDAYYEHLKSHPNIFRYKCRYCNREFCVLDALEQHEKLHLEDRPFVCKICSKTFKQNAHLTRHMNVHTRSRKFPCNFCDKVFTQASNRTVHIRLHTGETPYECSNCLKRFSERKMFKNHSVKCLEMSQNQSESYDMKKY